MVIPTFLSRTTYNHGEIEEAFWLKYKGLRYWGIKKISGRLKHQIGRIEIPNYFLRNVFYFNNDKM